MAFCPFAVQQIIPESGSQGRINPTTLIFHEAVSTAESLYAYWTTPGVELESHFYIARSGTIYQYMDTNVRADANVDANSFAISVETWDDGNKDPNLAWNPAMLASAKRLAAWVCDVHGIKKGPALTWNGGGIGGHNWFPYPWAAGPRQCPGVSRNAQIRNEIIPFVAGGGQWNGESDMTPEEHNALFEVLDKVRRVNAFMAESANAPGGRTVHDVLQAMEAQAAEDAGAVTAQFDTVNGRLDGIGSGGINVPELAQEIVDRTPLVDVQGEVIDVLKAANQRFDFGPEGT